MTNVSFALRLRRKRTVSSPRLDGVALTELTVGRPRDGAQASLFVVGQASARSPAPSPSESIGPPSTTGLGSGAGALTAVGRGATLAPAGGVAVTAGTSPAGGALLGGGGGGGGGDAGGGGVVPPPSVVAAWRLGSSGNGSAALSTPSPSRSG